MLSTRKGRAGAAVLAASVVAGGLALGVGPASAGTSTLFTITAVSPHLVSANTANQVITVTGTGFNEDDIASVTIDGCSTAPSYIAASPTTLILKTVGTTCTGVGNTITVTDSASNTYATNPATAATKLDFVSAPSLMAIVANGATTQHPVLEANTALQTGYDQVLTAPVTGGTTIKVQASASGTQYATSTAFPLTASLGGVPLTSIVMHTGGDYFTGKVGAHAATTGGVPLTITSNGVSKTFSGTLTGFNYTGTTISIAPAFGPSDGGNLVKVTGAGFVPATATVDFKCGSVTTPGTIVSTGSTATLLNVTAPMFPDATAGSTTAADGPCTVIVNTAGSSVTGNAVSIINGGSTYTYVAQG